MVANSTMFAKIKIKLFFKREQFTVNRFVEDLALCKKASIAAAAAAACFRAERDPISAIVDFVPYRAPIQ